LNGLSPAAFLEALKKVGHLTETPPPPRRRLRKFDFTWAGSGTALLCRAARHRSVSRPRRFGPSDRVSPRSWPSDDPRTSERISFVGGIRGRSIWKKRSIRAAPPWPSPCSDKRLPAHGTSPTRTRSCPPRALGSSRSSAPALHQTYSRPRHECTPSFPGFRHRRGRAALSRVHLRRGAPRRDDPCVAFHARFLPAARRHP
jgi:hypothetical protein